MSERNPYKIVEALIASGDERAALSFLIDFAFQQGCIIREILDKHHNGELYLNLESLTRRYGSQAHEAAGAYFTREEEGVLLVKSGISEVVYEPVAGHA